MEKILNKIDQIETAIALRNPDLLSSLLAELASDLDDVEVPSSALQSVIKHLQLLRLRIEAIDAGLSNALKDLKDIIRVGSKVDAYDCDGNRFEAAGCRSISVRC